MTVQNATGTKRAALMSVVLWAAASVALSVLWYRLWFYHHFPGATGILIKLTRADGENAYDAMAAEMFVIAGVLMAAAVRGVWWYSRQRRRSTPIVQGP